MIELAGLGVLDAPVKPGHDSGVWSNQRRSRKKSLSSRAASLSPTPE
ncbi:hypothetical protein Bra471DRAFT_06713 [Bradyrhizobium sp. WSM471]|nr:hypothetical protein Bra471DRAFT_06713 [Bradyrhizobium sp. WSM471]